MVFMNCLPASGKNIPPRKIFTLIELLIVIAIIALLAAMLLPALRNAKRMALANGCRANLKQVALASLNYALDWNGTIPYAGETADWASWQDATGNWYEKLSDGRIYQRGSNGGTAMHCPQATITVLPRWIYVDRSDFDFTANYNLTMKKTGGGWNTMGPYQKWLNEKIFWYADAQFGTFNNEYYAGPWTTFSKTSLPWTSNPLSPLYGKGHPGNAGNFIFGDHHVESLTREKIAGRTTGDSFWPPSPFCDFNGWAKP
jgi:prepilin-type N-terminal cleavage/methylation domain-containing protein